MDASFWHDKWENQLIGFHQDDINPFLKRHWSAIGHDRGRILVPLCGKSLDMVWLADHGETVVGCELSELAVTSFFRERGLSPEVETHSSLTCHRAGAYELWQGDMFQLQSQDLEPVSAFYDRAALIALPHEMRGAYWRKLASLMAPGTQGLLITLDYPQQQLSGPPFAIGESQLRQLSDGLFRVELLARVDVLAQNPRFLNKGVERLDELVFRLTRL
ncbi:thiopurine S-methyltransferase [Ferrimonas sediminicola]|uniref:Thiopurine S-methyltransferase n=1 Tax=Ferrimonas sediminicola TaxID=2569538 RepID=A0A4U1BBF0_9GAMM|nr:thiopurine S-methyltransferase [Ferrimonas sediminicola]TKB48091.1 thiopurine S-methyltransferase [Ferrimonas sediminicola]